MEMKRYLIALGGNAILAKNPTAEAQQEALKDTAQKLSALIKAGNEVVITHGNGPQVGNLLLQQIAADSKENPALPLDTLVSMTQGSIGYWLQQSLQNALNNEGIDKKMMTILTQVIVDENDPAFATPSKPIGPFLTEAEVKELSESAHYKEDAGRGWRKVVPSPKPSHIVESEAIKKMLEEGFLTIACGGGGVPVVQKNGYLKGVEAVIDKDFASAKLADLIDADVFIILTAVDHAYLHYNEPNQKKIETVSVEKMEHYIEEGHFASGSMLPKVESVIEFVKHSNKRKAVITSLDSIEQAIEGSGGTIIIP